MNPLNAIERLIEDRHVLKHPFYVAWREGTLPREALRTYAAQVAREITGPDGPAVLHLAVALSSSGKQGLKAGYDLRAERTRQLQSMLDRAHERGEPAPDALDVLDHVLAPMYIRVLFGMGPLTPEYVDGLVDRLL